MKKQSIKAEYTFQETNIYKKAFKQAMDIFEISKSFPKEETYSLTDQIRRSSRSVCANYAEAQRKTDWLRRRSKSSERFHLIRKELKNVSFFSIVRVLRISENSETLVWLDFALACEYIIQDKYDESVSLNSEIGKLLGHALMNPEKY